MLLVTCPRSLFNQTGNVETFAQFFQAEGRKDEDGRLISMAITPVEKVLPEYLDNYQVFEEKAVEHFMSDLRKIPPAIQP